MITAAWILILVTNNNYFHDLKNYPELEFRAYRTLAAGIHCLMLESFVGPCPGGHEAAHLDGKSAHNVLSNLAWVTPTVNASHKVLHGTVLYGQDHPTAKLNEQQVREIFSLRQSGLTLSNIASHFGVCLQLVSQIATGKIWKHLNLLNEASTAAELEGEP